MAMPILTAPLLEWALWYASQGHPVFPCHTPTSKGCSCRRDDCGSVGKHPRIREWQKEATTDTDQLRAWWKQWPLANIGLQTGVTCFVLDMDPRKGGDNELHTLEQTYGELPHTPQSHTGGGGAHFAFAIPPHTTIRNAVEVALGLDIRGVHGFVVVPPSLHVSGQRYCWDSAADLEDTPIADAPPWLLERCEQMQQHAALSPESPITKGRRNDILSTMAYHMRKGAMSLEEIYTAIQKVNERCVPPLDEEELKTLVHGKRDIGPDPVLRTRKNAPKNDDEATTWPDLVVADAILEAQHPLPQWLVHGLIPEGLTIVGGLPKVAKSYFAYDIALACAGKGLGLGHFSVERGRVAYLAIEDDPGDTQQRMIELRPNLTNVGDLFFLHGEAVPTITEGLVDYLRAKVTAHALSLVIVDPLSYVYDPKVGKQTDSFREAKDMLLPLRQLARELHFCLIFVDHRRKQGKDDADVFQTLYGSVAKYAVADAMIMMIRRDDEVTLHCRGRKIKDQVIACELNFYEGHAYWKVHGTNDAYASDSLKNKIVNAFKEAERLTHRRTLSLADVLLFAELEQTPQMKETLRIIMFRMCRDGLLIKADRNLFLLTGDDDTNGIVV